MQDSSDGQAHQSQQSADTLGREIPNEAGNLDQGRTVVHSQTGILQANESNEQADAHRYTPFQGQRNGIENGFTDIGHGQGDEDQTLCKHSQQRDLPGVTHALHNGVGQVSIQAHTCGENKGHIGHHRHTDSANKGSNGSCQQHRCGIHACISQDTGIHCQNVGHGHKGGNTGHDLGLDSGVMLLEFEQFFQHKHPTFFYFLPAYYNTGFRTITTGICKHTVWI